jgi:hypothetical protein
MKSDAGVDFERLNFKQLVPSAYRAMPGAGILCSRERPGAFTA